MCSLSSEETRSQRFLSWPEALSLWVQSLWGANWAARQRQLGKLDYCGVLLITMYLSRILLRLNIVARWLCTPVCPPPCNKCTRFTDRCMCAHTCAFMHACSQKCRCAHNHRHTHTHAYTFTFPSPALPFIQTDIPCGTHRPLPHCGPYLWWNLCVFRVDTLSSDVHRLLKAWHGMRIQTSEARQSSACRLPEECDGSFETGTPRSKVG